MIYWDSSYEVLYLVSYMKTTLAYSVRNYIELINYGSKDSVFIAVFWKCTKDVVERIDDFVMNHCCGLNCII